MKLNEPNILKVRLHKIHLDREIEPVRVMMTGDWHISPIVSEQQYQFLSEAIDAARPDVIILQGDLVDSPIELKRDTSLKKLLLELKLCSAHAKTVLVLGSHDFITPTEPPRIMKKSALLAWRKICEKCDVELLLNNWTSYKNLHIFGMFQDERCMLFTDDNGDKHYQDNPGGFLKNLEDAEQKIADGLARTDSGDVKWLAAHAPLINDAVIEKLHDFDVASFGHTHGGVVPLVMDEALEKLNLHFGLISPNHKPFPRRVRGAMPISENTTMIVNPGMIATHFCVAKLLQDLNFLKAAEVSVAEISGPR